MSYLTIAQHEAAHIVVGQALGLRLKRAVLEAPRPGWTASGGVWFDGRFGTTEAWGLMLSAGVAWELATAGNTEGAAGDLALLRTMHVHTKPRVRALAIASAAMLSRLGPSHAKITKALLEHGEIPFEGDL